VVSGAAVLRAAVERNDLAEVERLVAADRRLVRSLLGLTYSADPAVRETAADGIARAAEHHPALVTEVLRRLIWAMNDESGTNAVHAPLVIRRIAETVPRLLVGMVPDLLRLTADPGLRDELVAAVRKVAEALPAQAAGALRGGLGKCASGGRSHAA
jgi:hypothetical protein